MKHIWKGASALVLLGATVLALAPGCVENEGSFFIISAKSPSCGSTTVDSDDLGSGTLDTVYGGGAYRATLLLGNQLVRRGNASKLQIETSRISLTGVDVEILVGGETFSRLDGSPAAFSDALVGFVDPARNNAPGFGLAQPLVIDGATIQALQAGAVSNVTARIVVRGRTLGGDDIKTRPWDFPIAVCAGCLCTCPDSEPTEECAVGQDVPFHCAFLDSGSCQ